MSLIERIEPRSGVAFKLKTGDVLHITDPQGEQVSDFFCFAEGDLEEYFSSGRTIDYLSRIYVKKGDPLYSSKSRVMVTIIEDDVQSHDILLTPCSKDTFEILYDNEPTHPGCEGNLLSAFQREFNFTLSCLPSTFNVFMRVDINSDGIIDVLPPTSKAGDTISLRAEMDLIVGLTACSAKGSNNGVFKPIDYKIDRMKKS